ncbi:hypothetical protein A1O1_00176 [Capronia coronata CBS 617.96]|uniref:Anaphase-promoting complex subunit 4-like WD40 domain-containing protein n=1 Tax=Capronia coronata CBS 617.96 TaxID=1182541 RepID=W9YR81_9EURO|nr:uncharacterized protein A1O1_00176 [Capronia coronata CBS 617.96]EXJ95058.1 hypothetical protein A1O1_00176 [Capronia coronata CBS 617.96]
MEADNPSTFSAKPPPLSSDQLNYLVWRYLQESGYAEAAVKLQRDWRVNAESLPFAKSIKGQALVSLVQKGLRYHHLSLTIDENGRPSKQLDPSMFFFGPESAKPLPELPLPEETVTSATSPAGSTTTLQNKGRDYVFPEIPIQPPAKRSRKAERNGSGARKVSASASRHGNAPATDVEMTNGHPTSRADARSPSATEAGPDDNAHLVNGTRTDDRMDVDDDSLPAEQAHHEPHVEVLPPPSHTLTNGESIGVQVAPAKVTNLSASTSLLQIPSSAGFDNSKSITRTAWQPGDKDSLTALGDNFCGVWRSKSHPSYPDQHPHFQELVDPAEVKLISALAWDPAGDILAVATYTDPSGEILLFDGQEFNLMEALPASQKAITTLRWHRQGSRLLGIAPFSSDVPEAAHNAGSTILLWDLSEASNITRPLSVSVPETLMDIDCASFDMNGIVCAAGGNAVYHCRAFSDLGIEHKWTSNPNENDSWTLVRCAWGGPMDGIVVAASGESGSLWLPVQALMKREAHDAPITGLELRPYPPGTSSSTSKREFATSSTDGTVKVWLYDEANNTILSLCKLILGHASPAMTLSYSPDGFCLAAASYDTVRIWNAEHGHNHMATWKGEPDSWGGSKLKEDDIMSIGGMSGMNGDGPQAIADHTLAWDSESRKLAFGLGSQIAVIDFQR